MTPEGPNIRCWHKLSSLLHTASENFRTNGRPSFHFQNIWPNTIVLTKATSSSGPVKCEVSFDPATEVLRVQGPANWNPWQYTASYRKGVYCPDQFVSLEGDRAVEAFDLANNITNRVL